MGVKIITLTTTLLLLVCLNVVPSPANASFDARMQNSNWFNWPQWGGQPNLGDSQENNNQAKAAAKPKAANGELKVGFYDDLCPEAEKIIQDVVRTSISNDPGVSAALIRLFFHDCFVKGCDASILLDYTPSGEPTEKTSKGNIGIGGFDVIDQIKTRLEEACPEIVSCADIISFATRDTVTQARIPHYDVEAGRRDGLSSTEKSILGNLPLPDANVEQMDKIFSKKGMSKQDMVALLGAHSIGVAHCVVVEKEFSSYSATSDYDPSLDKSYAMQLKNACPPPGTAKDEVVPLNDMNHENKLSNVYFSNVINGRTAVPADQSLLKDQTTSDLVHMYASELQKWVNDFRDSMIKLGKVEVLTGDKGEIRSSCRVVNI